MFYVKATALTRSFNIIIASMHKQQNVNSIVLSTLYIVSRMSILLIICVTAKRYYFLLSSLAAEQTLVEWFLCGRCGDVVDGAELYPLLLYM